MDKLILITYKDDKKKNIKKTIIVDKDYDIQNLCSNLWLLNIEHYDIFEAKLLQTH